MSIDAVSAQVEARVDDPALEALVENHLFSRCAFLVPTRGSTFFNACRLCGNQPLCRAST